METKIIHPHSYRFPYIVERIAPAVYRVQHIRFVDDISGSEKKGELLIEEKSPSANGFIKESVKETILKIVLDWSKRVNRRMSVVFEPKECVNCEPDGTRENSQDVPSGGIDLFGTFDEIPPIPEGLKKCDKCGYFYGSCKYQERDWTVSCICNPQICDRCETPVYKWRIGSNQYEPRDATCWHISIYCAWGHSCPDGVKGQLKHSCFINPRTGDDLLHPIKN